MESESNSDSTRKLASVQVVDSVRKHPNADKLEIVTILGWEVITRIGEAKQAQVVVYCEVDSLLPVKADWLPPAVKDLIVDQSNDLEFFRVKTRKLRGELSQGLIVTVVPSISFADLPIGTDLTDKLGVEKFSRYFFFGSLTTCIEKRWEPNVSSTDTPAFVRGAPRVNPYPFPVELIPKSDESSVQSNPKLLAALQSKPFIVTVKHDGSSGTFLVDPKTDTFLACSRNQWRPEDPKDVYWEIAKTYNIDAKLRQHFPHLALQGEICGPKIQRNLLGLNKNTFYVFDVFDLKQRCWLSFDDMVSVCAKLGIPTVEFVQRGDCFAMDLKELLTLAEGVYPNTKNQREGIVVRSIDRSISFKVISNAYRLKNDY